MPVYGSDSCSCLIHSIFLSVYLLSLFFLSPSQISSRFSFSFPSHLMLHPISRLLLLLPKKHANIYESLFGCYSSSLFFFLLVETNIRCDILQTDSWETLPSPSFPFSWFFLKDSLSQEKQLFTWEKGREWKKVRRSRGSPGMRERYITGGSVRWPWLTLSLLLFFPLFFFACVFALSFSSSPQNPASESCEKEEKKCREGGGTWTRCWFLVPYSFSLLSVSTLLTAWDPVPVRDDGEQRPFVHRVRREEERESRADDEEVEGRMSREGKKRKEED